MPHSLQDTNGNFSETAVSKNMPQPIPLNAPDGTTPAGIQKTAVLTRRRWIFAALNGATYFGLLFWLAQILGASGWSVVDLSIFACFAIALPWGVLGIWNALIGLWLLHGRADGFAEVAPYAAAADTDTAIRSRTAVVMTVCNEAPERAIARLETIRASLNKTIAPSAYSYFLLSDTTDPLIAKAEEAAFYRWQTSCGAQADDVHYRRRIINTGYKAGNIKDFCERWGERFDFFLPLDADSLMTGQTIEKMVRIAQAWPKIGILQSLVVGAPSSSAFARIFQFGMRQGMRPYTMGSAWWTGDCGPFWGHNALVRMAPFRDHCELPELPENSRLGGRILSHDQVEAVLMRQAGYEVRVLPLEGGSWEDNPPDVMEFMQRDSRWCEGNMQYLHLLTSGKIMRGIKATSRFQLIWAVMMFIGLPAWGAIIALAALKPFDGENTAVFPATSAALFYTIFLLMFLAPKIAGYVDITVTRGGLAAYGGASRFALSALLEIIFSFLVAALVTFRTSAFMAGLLFGKRVGWAGQNRDGAGLNFKSAARALWPQTLFGLLLFVVAAISAPVLILISLPLTIGYVAAIPFAMTTAHPAFGKWLQRHRICAIPEELAPPPEITSVFSPPRQNTSDTTELPVAA